MESHNFNVQLLVNRLSSYFSFKAYNSKMSSVTPSIYWRIGSYLAMDARGKFGELLEYSKRPKCIHNSINAQLKAWANSFITWRRWNMVYLWLTTKCSKCTRKEVSHWMIKNTPQSSAFKTCQWKHRFFELIKMQANKVKILNESVDEVEMLKFRREVGFGLLRIMFTLPKLWLKKETRQRKLCS